MSGCVTAWVSFTEVLQPVATGPNWLNAHEADGVSKLKVAVLLAAVSVVLAVRGAPQYTA